jgi:hypothetical protein
LAIPLHPVYRFLSAWPRPDYSAKLVSFLSLPFLEPYPCTLLPIQGVLALLASIPIEELHLGEKGGPVGGGVHKPEEDVDERPPGDEEVQRSAV